MSSAHIALCRPTSTSHVFQLEMEDQQSLLNPQSTLLPLIFSSISPPLASSQATRNPHETVSVDKHYIFEFLEPSFLFPMINYLDFQQTN